MHFPLGRLLITYIAVLIILNKLSSFFNRIYVVPIDDVLSFLVNE